MKAVVYILEGSRYYVGSTINLERRILDYRRGHTYSTKRIGKWKLVKIIECENKKAAQNLEKEIKRSKNISRYV